MTELIVVLDVAETAQFDVLFQRLRIEAGVRFFKIGARALMMPSWWDNKNVVSYLRHYDVDVFLDLKAYDTKDTVERVAGRAFELGARFLTVHATPSMLEAAMRAKPPGDYCKVLGVSDLTDVPMTKVLDRWINRYRDALKIADGAVCPTWLAAEPIGLEFQFKLRVCPGIRTPGWGPANNHVNPATPSEAKAAGADYIVVGRPIYDAPDPVAAARAIMDELG